jgi:endogenous inhibitor of DNA gyrase (YacG/DUF329 family)
MASVSSASTSPRECPVCGAEVPRGARACPECGADERTGWNEEATRYDGLDLPDSAFDEAEPPTRMRKRAGSAASGMTGFWWVVAIIVVIAVGIGVVLRFG